MRKHADQLTLPYIGLLRERVCKQCGLSFSYEIGRGNDRYYCSDFCRTRRRHAHAKAQPLCVVEGCRNPRYYTSGLCNSCYYRLRRSGTVEKRVWKYRSLHSNGYIVVRCSDHPLSTPTGRVYEHRKVLYDAIGDGAHGCHWCGVQVRWIRGKCVKGSLVADHLDGDKTNNASTNLVPACNVCNAMRGLFMSWVSQHQDDPVLWRMYEDHQARRVNG